MCIRDRYEHSKTEINHKVITTEEFNHIIERFPMGTTFHIPIMIGYYTGCRIGEVMALTWDDIDLEKGTIDVCLLYTSYKMEWKDVLKK